MTRRPSTLPRASQSRPSLMLLRGNRLNGNSELPGGGYCHQIGRLLAGSDARPRHLPSTICQPIEAHREWLLHHCHGDEGRAGIQ